MIRLPGYVAHEHVVTVPLDHSAPDGATIDVFARELDPGKQEDDLPCLLFLQGGPGGRSPRPVDRRDDVLLDVPRGPLPASVAEAADLLAAKEDWPPLYDLDRLARNEVPLCAAVYYDDLYVDSELQLQTIERVGNARAWVTNEREHDGLHSAPAVLERLFDMGVGALLGLSPSRLTPVKDGQPEHLLDGTHRPFERYLRHRFSRFPSSVPGAPRENRAVRDSGQDGGHARE